MSYMNKVYLLGRLTRDVDHRGMPSGNSVCTFGLATSRKYNQNGQEKEETCFVDVKVWGKTADICRQYLSKGSQVLIEGRLTLEQWEDRNSGEKRQKLTVTAENVQFIGNRRDDNGNRNGGYQQQPQPQQSAARPPVDNDYAPPPQIPDYGVDEEVPF